MADDHHEVAESFVRQARRQVQHGIAAGCDERGPVREVFDRIAGEGHLGGDEQVGTGFVGTARGIEDKVRVGSDGAYGRVQLGEGKSQVRHASTLKDARSLASRRTGAPFVRGGVCPGRSAGERVEDVCAGEFGQQTSGDEQLGATHPRSQDEDLAVDQRGLNEDRPVDG